MTREEAIVMIEEMDDGFAKEIFRKNPDMFIAFIPKTLIPVGLKKSKKQHTANTKCPFCPKDNPCNQEHCSYTKGTK